MRCSESANVKDLLFEVSIFNKISCNQAKCHAVFGKIIAYLSKPNIPDNILLIEFIVPLLLVRQTMKFNMEAVIMLGRLSLSSEWLVAKFLLEKKSVH
jgi:hypothetical protein